jgi:hypothetical protein
MTGDDKQRIIVRQERDVPYRRAQGYFSIATSGSTD